MVHSKTERRVVSAQHAKGTLQFHSPADRWGACLSVTTRYPHTNVELTLTKHSRPLLCQRRIWLQRTNCC